MNNKKQRNSKVKNNINFVLNLKLLTLTKTNKK